MTIHINPGSGPVDGGTESQALENARGWLRSMQERGIRGVELIERSTFYDRGRWTFGFRHTLTGFVCELDIHGLTAEQERAFLFPPRIYWRGCSSSIPELTDWLTDGFEIAIVRAASPDKEAA